MGILLNISGNIPAKMIYNYLSKRKYPNLFPIQFFGYLQQKINKSCQIKTRIS